MADDGMILNFASSEVVPAAAQHKFKGGSWKDRLKAKNEARGKPTSKPTGQENDDRKNDWKHADSVNNIPITNSRTEDFPNPRPTKRRKENNYDEEGRTSFTSHGPRRSQTSEKRSLEKGVVSSLFTSNPKSATVIPKPTEGAVEEKPSQPSNAPLIDGIDTFTSLGLSTSVAAHLLTKMKLKSPTAIQKAAITQMLKEDGDAFIQSETGSGKTLAYLLPVVQRIMTMTERLKQSDNDTSADLHRDSGLFAIILAPTRELCKQISVVLDKLLGCANYIVATTVVGGEKKKSEKARLRKGINILVATPGRLVDHLENTEVLNVSQVRWLVLDEGDRLMDMGFEEDITKIVKAMDQKRRKSVVPGLPDTRTTVLCSATLKMNVQKLGDISLRDAALIRGETQDDLFLEDPQKSTSSAFLAPAQLKQSYLVVPAKLRLVTLAALLKHTFARKGSVMKAIVFFSCADSVDFHFKAFTRAVSNSNDAEPDTEKPSSPEINPSLDATAPAPMISPDLTLHRLHGSLPQATRTSIVKSFSASTTPSLLLATDVASRGLDLPNLDLVIEYDPAFASDDHLHRIGRTARLGRDGRATIFLMPGKEESYTTILRSSFKTSETGSASVTQTDAEDILRKGFSPATGIVGKQGQKRQYELKATEWQLGVERWVIDDKEIYEMAKKGFQSHVRAYATHVAAERPYFDIKELHLGHLAKAFGLRDAPGGMNVAGMRGKESGKKRYRMATAGGDKNYGGKNGVVNDGIDQDKMDKESEEAANKMRQMVRNRKLMMGGGADEFNLA